MSLVEDALRKQEQEAGKQFVSAAPTVVTSPVFPAASARPPLSPPAASPPVIARPGPGLPSDAGRQRSLVFVGVGLLALLLAAGVFFLMTEKAEKPAVSIAAAPATKPSIPPPVIALPPPFIAAVAPVVASVAPVVPHPVADSNPIASAAPAPLVSNATVAAVTPVGSVAGDPVSVAPPPPPAVIWPELAIKGIFSAGGKTLVPLGDGLTLETGATAPNGVRLLEATPASIRVAFRGEVRTYRRKGGSFIACTNGISGL